VKRDDLLAFACILVPQIIVAFSGPPPLLPPQLAEPTYIAHVSTRAVTSALVIARCAGLPAKLEQLQLASFLAGMPVIYLWAAALRGAPADVGVEALGLVVFGAAAVLGFFRSPKLLAAAIGLHGVAWDAWHHGSSFIAGWYVIGCLLVDLGFAAYGFLLLPRLAAERASAIS
jgi:hypothetical protein